MIRHFCLSLNPAGQNALPLPVWHYRVRDGCLDGRERRWRLTPVRSKQDEREGYHIRATKHGIHNQFKQHMTKLKYDYFKNMQCD